MKMFISFGILFSGLLAFAGPEDHVQAQVCYNFVVKPGQPVPSLSSRIPSQICLEEISHNPLKGTAYIYSYFTPGYYENVKVDSLVRQTEDTYRVELSSVIFEDWSRICDDGQTVTLKIKAESDFLGNIQKDKLLSVTVEDEFTNDSCHTPSHTTVYEYSL